MNFIMNQINLGTMKLVCLQYATIIKCQAKFFAISVDDIAMSCNERTRQILSISAIHRGDKRFQITMLWYGLKMNGGGGGGGGGGA